MPATTGTSDQDPARGIAGDGRLARALRPSRIVAFAVLASIPVRLMAKRLADPDVWWHLQTGELIARDRRIPTEDVFSYTATGADWTVQEWGAELLLHWLREAFGLWGIFAFRAVGVLLVYLVVARILTRRMGSGMGTWALVALTAYAGASNWTERPNLLSFLLFALTLDLIERRHRVAIWAFVPIAFVWANLHGMVLVGLGLVALVAVTERIKVAMGGGRMDRAWARRLGIVWVVAFAASFANPRGPGLYTHAFSLVRTVRDVVTEWASPNFHEIGVQVFLVLLLLTIAALILDPKRVDLTDLALTLAFVFLALQAVRNLAISSIVLGTVAAGALPGAMRSLRPEPPAERPATRPSVPLGLAGLLATIIGLGVVVAAGLPDSDDPADIVEDTFAIEAIDALARPGIRVFAYDVWAPMVIDRAWPDARVFFDTRVDVYGEERTAAYRRTISGLPGWDRALDETCTTHVLIQERHPLNQLLEQSFDWIVEREDERSVTYARARQAVGCEEFPIPRA